MKLTIKTLDQITFQVDFDESETVWDLKTHLCQMPEVGVQPDQQQLIYAGRVLDNGNRLSTYNIDERKFLVVMAKKTPTGSQPASQAQATDTTGTQLASQTQTMALNEAKRETKPVKSDDQPQSSKQQQNQPTQSQVKPPAAVAQIPTQANILGELDVAPTVQIDEELVANIISMGYPEADVRRALLASYNNPDRAIEYLIDGIPEGPEAIAMAGPPEIQPNATEHPLAFLRDDPRFAQMRSLIQQRPQLLRSVLVRIGETNPGLLAIIREHQEEFVRMINESDDVMQAAADPAQEVVDGIGLTDQDRMAIERLVALGFSRPIVLQAYIACEKNEEQTADFLCQHADEN